ncbi:hypothetical protein ACWGQQ_34445 [Bradyrhizobium sp. Lot33]
MRACSRAKQTDCIHIEKITYAFLFQDKAKPPGHGARFKFAIERSLWMHESGTYVKITPEAAEMLI